MTAKEIYYKAKFYANLPMELLGYLFKDEYGVIQIGATIIVSYKDDIDTALAEIEKMEVIEKQEGFMFWNISPEGEKFKEDNIEAIANALINIIMDSK